MKKKFTTIIALLLAVVMVFPSAVFAETTQGSGTESSTESGAGGSDPEPTPPPAFEIKKGTATVSGTTIDIFDGGSNKTVTLKVPDYYKNNVTWSSSDPSVATVADGVVTAKAISGDAAKEAVIIVDYRDPETFVTTTKTCTVRVTHRHITEVQVTATKNSFYVGDTIDKSHLVVKAKYNDSDAWLTLKNEEYTIVSPTAALKTTDVKVVVKAESQEDDAAITVNAVDITSLIDRIEVVEPTRLNYNEGDTMEGVSIKVYYKDSANPPIIINNATAGVTQTPAGGTKLNTPGDVTLTVTYEGKTATATLKVKAKETTPSGGDSSGSTTTGNTIEFDGTIPKTYKVGDSIDFSKVTKVYLVKNGVKTGYTGTTMNTIINKLKSALVFKTEHIGENKSVSIKVTVTIGSTASEYTLTLTGLTITENFEDANKSDKDGPYKIVDLEMKKDKYEVGYEFDLDDIDFVEVKWTTGTSAYEIAGKDLKDYKADPELEVLDKDGDRKSSSTYRDTIQEADVITDRYGEKYVQLRLTFGDEEYEFDVEIGAEPIQFIYRSKVIITYDDMEDALEATLEQDKDVSTDDFKLSNVTSSRPITLKLGEDAELDDDYEYDPDYPVIIDLNGHTLTIHSTTVDMSKKNDGHLTITNTSSTAGKVIYDDMEVTVSVAKNKELVFEYDADTLPGLYVVEVTVGKNGTVSAKPKLDSKSKVEAGTGTEITFTITPAKNYQLDVFKADGKTVAASAYTKNTSGVITYKYTVGTADGKIEVSFKEIKEVKPEWDNPYTDVRDNASYYDAVEFVTVNNLMNGTSTDSRNQTFSPNKTMNRAMFVTVLGRLAGVDTSRYTKSSFIDVPINSSTSWYAPYVEWANQNGIIQGYGNGKFGPMDEITHQQMYTIVYRYAIFVENISFRSSNYTINVSDKNDIDSYAVDGVKFATAYDMLVTSGGRITPKGDALRWELATILQLFCENVLKWEVED